jgi:hypothetical protein
MRRYYLHTRNGIFYAELVSPKGRKLAARSAGTATEDEALLVVADWLKNGVPTDRDRKPRPADKRAFVASLVAAATGQV